jgi:hypothetical protein
MYSEIIQARAMMPKRTKGDEMNAQGTWWNLDWINNLPEVGRPILSKLADIRQDISDIDAKIKELEALKTQVFIEDIEPLMATIEKLWSKDEISAARNQE